MAKSKYKSIDESRQLENKIKTCEFNYDVSLAVENDPKLFRLFYQSNKLDEAKKIAISKANAEGRETILWDNKACWIIFRYKPYNDSTGDKTKK